MLDHAHEITAASGVMILWLSLTTGLLGSAHCVGMCGGLVMATTNSFFSNLSYQFGRLLGYLFLGLIGGYITSYLSVDFKNPWVAALPTIALGLFFIWMGVSQYKNKPVHLPIPKFLSSLSQKAMAKVFKSSSSMSTRAFFVGLLSFLLPCGFLYGVVLISTSFQDPLKAMGVMTFFWLGTLPALSFAPQIIMKVFSPLQKSYPHFISFGFIAFGLGTLAVRFYGIYQTGGQSCH